MEVKENLTKESYILNIICIEPVLTPNRTIATKKFTSKKENATGTPDSMTIIKPAKKDNSSIHHSIKSPLVFLYNPVQKFKQHEQTANGNDDQKNVLR